MADTLSPIIGQASLTVLVAAAIGLVLSLPLIAHPSTPGIDKRAHPKGLASLEPVDINGTRQWVLIRSDNVEHPILLFLHGGPGTAELTLNRQAGRALEHFFTVVNWDQRGAGKSFAAGRDTAGMRIEQFVADTIALATDLTRRFHKKQLVLVGHSWGSVIGLLAVQRRPDLFAAYVGIGQMSNTAEGESLSYQWTLDQARAAGDQRSIETLTRIGPPPYTGPDWRAKFLTERRLLGKFGGEYYGSRIGAFGAVITSLLSSREYSVRDRINFFRGIFWSLDALHEELSRTNLFEAVSEVQVPVYFCLGRHDYEVPSPLSARYFDALKAPRKQLVWFEHSSHLPNIEERDAFNDFVIHTVLPGMLTVRSSLNAETA